MQELEEDKSKQNKSKKKVAVSMTPTPLAQKLTFRCVMTQDNHAASHKAGYTALLLDAKRSGLVGVTTDHNLLMLGAPDGVAAVTGGGRGKEALPLVTRRQIVGYNDEVIDIKSVPDGVLSGSDGQESWVAVATNSPQVSFPLLGRKGGDGRGGGGG